MCIFVSHYCTRICILITEHHVGFTVSVIVILPRTHNSCTRIHLFIVSIFSILILHHQKLYFLPRLLLQFLRYFLWINPSCNHHPVIHHVNCELLHTCSTMPAAFQNQPRDKGNGENL